MFAINSMILFVFSQYGVSRQLSIITYMLHLKLFNNSRAKHKGNQYREVILDI